MVGRLEPLSEEPIVSEDQSDYAWSSSSRSSRWSSNNKHMSTRSARAQTWRQWLKAQLSLLVFTKRSHDLKLLLSVLACPLFPLSLHHQHPINHEVSSSAQYIIQHFTAATGCRKLERAVKNVFATGKVTMAMGDHELGSAGVSATGTTSSSSSSRVSQKGCFVMWQMAPNMWLIELVAGGHKVIAGSDGNVAWRHTPWLSAHAAKGGVRPLRRALQGLDPLAVAAVFSPAQYIGEKRISSVDCFMLKLSADQTDLIERSDSTAEMIKHVIFGYFSQRSGLLVYLEDSYLTRIQSPGTYPTYWETTMSTKIDDYRTVEGVMIAHSGQTNVIITRFGDNLKAGPAITRMEECWTIDDVAFNVPGLSLDCFIAPNEVHNHFPLEEKLDWRSPQ